MLKTGEWSADAYIGKYENRLCNEGFLRGSARPITAPYIDEGNAVGRDQVS